MRLMPNVPYTYIHTYIHTYTEMRLMPKVKAGDLAKALFMTPMAAKAASLPTPMYQVCMYVCMCVYLYMCIYTYIKYL